MFKRVVISFIAVGLVTIFTADLANAYSRYRRSVDSIHEYPIPGLASDPGSVRDILYGALLTGDTLGECAANGNLWKPEDTVTNQADGAVIIVAAGCYRPTCVITGNVECFTEDCVESLPDTTIGITEFSSESVADFLNGSATGNAPFLSTNVSDLCVNLGYDSANVKPDAVIGFTTYYAGSGATPGDEVGRLIDVCPIFYKNDALYDQFNCTVAWQDFEYEAGFPVQSGDLPLLPCCGQEGLLDVTVVGDGTVIGQGIPPSDSPIIDCDKNVGECSQYYNNVLPLSDPNAYNGCPEPEITLTATADTNWEFSHWTGPCTGGDLTDPTCIVTAAQGYGSVTATFEPLCQTLTVEIINNDKNDIVYIFQPDNIYFDTPDSAEGSNQCDWKDEGVDGRTICTREFCDEPVTVTLKKKGDSITWQGDCTGVPNNFDCSLSMGVSHTVTVDFAD